ncbi:MAG TPA: hypothetical protein VFQ51_19335 [Vicinamibacteria bacterium]|nr:hypothetical protein [Vicinamibacteria bacterium]
MKRFVLEVAAFLALQAAIAVALEWTYQSQLGRGHYLAALSDKERLLRTTRPPRVLLVGGSSLAFGVDSRQLEDALGVPVRNLALNAGLGLDLILRQAEKGLVPGDRVLLSPEYRLLDPGTPFDSSTVWQAVALVPAMARYLSPRAVPQLLDDGLALPHQRLSGLWTWVRAGRPGQLYRRQGFDDRGDFVGHLDLASEQGNNRHARIPPPDDLADAVELLSRFARRARSLGVEVVILPPPFPADDEPSRHDAVGRIWRTVSHETGMRVIPVWSPDRSLFYDTEYHLTREGRRAHTQEILRALRAAPGDVVASGP